MKLYRIRIDRSVAAEDPEAAVCAFVEQLAGDRFEPDSVEEIEGCDDLEARTDELVDLAEDLGVEPFDLDMFVHELTADADAAAINNGGLDSQIEFLLRELGYSRTREIIEEAAGDQEAQPQEG